MNEETAREMVRFCKTLPFKLRLVTKGPHKGPFVDSGLPFFITQSPGLDFSIDVVVDVEDLYDYIGEEG